MRKRALWMSGCVLLGALAARGQEAPRPSLARATEQQPVYPTLYNLKAGPVLFRINASLRAEFVDNINLANGKDTPVESDFILSPQIGLDVNWTFSKLNNLHLHTTLGYTKYFSHPELDSSTVLFSPDSILAFNIYVGDFKITLHDQFSYQEDPIGEGALSNVEKFARFTNTAGVDVLWDLNSVILTLGYDHTNLITTSASRVDERQADLSSLDHTVDQIAAAAFLPLSSSLGIGLEATGSSVRFPSDDRGDYTRLTVGPFVESQLTRYTKLSLSAGYEDSSFSGNNGDAGAYYVNVSLFNRLNQFLISQLTAGHENQAGLFSQQTETTFATLTFRYQVTPQIFVSTVASYADTDEEGSVTELVGRVGSLHFQTFGLSVSTDYEITKKLTLSLGYQFTRRTGSSTTRSEITNQDYTQNRVFLVLGYQF